LRIWDAARRGLGRLPSELRADDDRADVCVAAV